MLPVIAVPDRPLRSSFRRCSRRCHYFCSICTYCRPGCIVVVVFVLQGDVVAVVISIFIVILDFVVDAYLPISVVNGIFILCLKSWQSIDIMRSLHGSL